MKLQIDFSKVIGKIKPMHAINNAPIYGTDNFMFHYLNDAKIPFSRLHDTGGEYGGNRFVDIENIFRNWEEDETDSNSYDFAFTDWLLEELVGQGVEPFFRLGTTIENGHRIKAYRIFPPKDNLKWAKICEHIIAHYNEGWADGYHMGIRYWEIWNEPDNEPDMNDSPMWKGTFEEYIDLYKQTAIYLKNRFGDSIKVGGYASCGFYAILDQYVAVANSSPRTEYFIECFHKFMKAVKADNVPLDFFSWHSYSQVDANIIYTKYVREQLDSYGYGKTESILNEWNPGHYNRGTLLDSAKVSSNMIALQNEALDMLMYYDGQINGRFQGLFNPIAFEPFKTYYVFKAFSELYALKNSVRVCSDDENIYCVAAKSDNREAVMITNLGIKNTIDIDALNSAATEYKLYRLNNEKNLELCDTVLDTSDIEIDENETILLLSFGG